MSQAGLCWDQKCSLHTAASSHLSMSHGKLLERLANGLCRAVQRVSITRYSTLHHSMRPHLQLLRKRVHAEPERSVALDCKLGCLFTSGVNELYTLLLPERPEVLSFT